MMRRFVAVLALLFMVSAMLAQHGHINAGARGTNANDQLYWVNGAIFAAESGFVKDLVWATTGKFSNTFEGSFTPVALPATIDNGGPVANHPALGSFLVGEFMAVTGPVGSAFSFWESNSTTAPKFTMPAGSTNLGNRFNLSDPLNGAGAPGADPFGHIHGRRFTVNQPGIYNVLWRALDISTNGPNGGPTHTPSDPLRLAFRGAFTINRITREGMTDKLSFRSARDHVFQIEAADELARPLSQTVWHKLPTLYTGEDEFVTISIDQDANRMRRFYRLNVMDQRQTLSLPEPVSE